MSKVVAIMSMSLDGYVADRSDSVAEVVDWYFNSGDVTFATGGSTPMTVPGVRAERRAPGLKCAGSCPVTPGANSPT